MTPKLDIVTCEYPPSIGGVADYTQKIAEGLEHLGFANRVWVPGDETSLHVLDKVTRSLGRFGMRRLFLTDRLLGSAKGSCLLLQWEPVGFGLKSVNVPFCIWIASRVLRGSRLLVMFHETFLPFENATLKRSMAAILQRLIALTLVNFSETVFVSTAGGKRALQSLCFDSGKVHQLPVFSNIEPTYEPAKAAAWRQRLRAGDEVVVGHFGRYMCSVEPLVIPPLIKLLAIEPRAKVLLIGECGERYRASLLSSDPGVAKRVVVSGICPSDEIGALISACDFMFQPYPGGLTTKRSSCMASLANGKFVVSNGGPETETIWQRCEGVHLVGTSDAAQVADELAGFIRAPRSIEQASSAAVAFYRQHFSLKHTLNAFAAHLGSSEGARSLAVELS